MIPVAIPFLRQRHQGTILQHDNATPHVARLINDYLQQENVQVLPWPACSPDMNPIEHLRNHIDRAIRRRNNVPDNIAQLEQALVEEWNRIPNYVIRMITWSMRRRIIACIDARGAHTRYEMPGVPIRDTLLCYFELLHVILHGLKK